MAIRPVYGAFCLVGRIYHETFQIPTFTQGSFCEARRDLHAEVPSPRICSLAPMERSTSFTTCVKKQCSIRYYHCLLAHPQQLQNLDLARVASAARKGFPGLDSIDRVLRKGVLRKGFGCRSRILPKVEGRGKNWVPEPRILGATRQRKRKSYSSAILRNGRI